MIFSKPGPVTNLSPLKSRGHFESECGNGRKSGPFLQRGSEKERNQFIGHDEQLHYRIGMRLNFLRSYAENLTVTGINRMVEPITTQALLQKTEDLSHVKILHPALRDEIIRLVEDSATVSNWIDASQYLSASGYQRIRAGGPVSKVLRTLAYMLEKLDERQAEIVRNDFVVTRVELQDTRSGCSTYSGRIHVQAEDQNGREVVLIDGSFVWDCAEHGIPQTQAARQLGYRCMVSFPSLAAMLPA